jgi:hypothetical protein
MRRPVTVSLALFALILSVFVGPTSVAADGGSVAHERGQFDKTFTVTDICPFPLTVHASFTFDDLLTFDASGNLVRVLETDRQVSIDYSANGKTLTAKGSGGVVDTFNADGSITIRTFGINLLVTIPGEGNIILDVGHSVAVLDPHYHVLFQAGPAVYDLPEFCAALT